MPEHCAALQPSSQYHFCECKGQASEGCHFKCWFQLALFNCCFCCFCCCRLDSSIFSHFKQAISKPQTRRAPFRGRKLSRTHSTRKYAYVEEGRGTALEGWQPWGLYLGTRYHVWLCSSLKRERLGLDRSIGKSQDELLLRRKYES